MRSLYLFFSISVKLSELSNLTVKGSEKLRILQRAILYGPEFLPKLEQYFQSQESTQVPKKTKDILLTGCSIFK